MSGVAPTYAPHSSCRVTVGWADDTAACGGEPAGWALDPIARAWLPACPLHAQVTR